MIADRVAPCRCFLSIYYGMPYLHRVADPDGFSLFVNALQRGLTEEQLLAILTSSAEYFAQL